MPEPTPLRTGPDNDSLEEERREVLASVLGALAGHQPDPDEMAACSHLLKHLSQTQTALRPASPASRPL